MLIQCGADSGPWRCRALSGVCPGGKSSNSAFTHNSIYTNSRHASTSWTWQILWQLTSGLWAVMCQLATFVLILGSCTVHRDMLTQPCLCGLLSFQKCDHPNLTLARTSSGLINSYILHSPSTRYITEFRLSDKRHCSNYSLTVARNRSIILQKQPEMRHMLGSFDKVGNVSSSLTLFFSCRCCCP